MIEKINFNGIPAVHFTAGGYEAVMVPSVGANVVKLKHTATGIEILRTPDAEEMENFKERPQIYGLPLLFPPNRIADGPIHSKAGSINTPSLFRHKTTTTTVSSKANRSPYPALSKGTTLSR